MSNPAASRYAVNTYSYTQHLSAGDCLRRLGDQGFVAFELMMYPGHCWPNDLSARERRQLAQLCRERGLRFTSLNMPNVDLNIAGATPESRRYSLAILRGVVELAGELEAPGVVIGPGKPNPLFPAARDQLLGWFHAALDELVPAAEQAGTKIFVENMPFGFLPLAGEMMDALDAYGDDEIGVVYDIANAVFAGEKLEEGFRAVQSRLRLVHVSDTGTAAYRHDPVGQGVVPFAEVPGHMARAGYAELPVLEIISRAPDTDIPGSIEQLGRMGWA